MIGWLYRMLVGRFSQCKHHWKEMRPAMVAGRIDEGRTKDQLICYVLQCEHCGDIKFRVWCTEYPFMGNNNS